MGEVKGALASLRNALARLFLRQVALISGLGYFLLAPLRAGGVRRVAMG